MSPSTPFIRRPVATTLLTFGLAAAGVVAFFKLPVSPLPQVDFPTISVQATLPGASPQDGEQRLHRVDGRDDVGAGLPVEDDQDGRLAIGDPGIADVFDPVGDFADVGDVDGGAIAIGHDQRFVVVRLGGLIIGVNLVAPVAHIDAALGAMRIGAGKRGANVFQADPVFVECLRNEVDAHRGQRATADGDLADAVDLRQFWRQYSRCRIVNLATRRSVGGQRQDQDRRVGRLTLR